MLTTSGRAAGVKNTGAAILPEADSSQTSSPCSIPNSTAVRGFISIHVPQTIEVMGSGSSCIQGRLAVFPSPNARDANGCREKGYSADSLSAGGKGSAPGRNVRSTVTRALSVASSTQTPLPFSALQKLFMSSAEKLPCLRTSSAPRLRLRYSRKSESGKAAPVLAPHLRARPSRTSAQSLDSYIDVTIGCTRDTTRVPAVTSGSTTSYLSRNVRSGSIRSAYAVESFMNELKAAIKGVFSRLSRAPADAGAL